jgi:excisionase family DNA binding protein
MRAAPSQQTYSLDQAAAMIGMSRPSLTKLIQAGRLGQPAAGARFRVPATAIAAFGERPRAHDAAELTGLGELANRVGQLD